MERTTRRGINVRKEKEFISKIAELKINSCYDGKELYFNEVRLINDFISRNQVSENGISILNDITRTNLYPYGRIDWTNVMISQNGLSSKFIEKYIGLIPEETIRELPITQKLENWFIEKYSGLLDMNLVIQRQILDTLFIKEHKDLFDKDLVIECQRLNPRTIEFIFS